MEVIHLRNSGLGKVVNFYTRCKRSQPEVIRQANLLIDRWSKPILDTGNSARASMRARAEADREDEGHRRGEGGERGEGSDSDNGRQKDRRQQRTGELLRQRVLSRGADEAAPQKGTRLPNVIVSRAKPFYLNATDSHCNQRDMPMPWLPKQGDQ
jgi:hypothetical protein